MVKKCLLTLLVFCGWIGMSCANQIDSLSALLTQQEGQLRIETLLAIAKLTPEAQQWLIEARTLSRDIRYQPGELNALIALGDFYADKDQSRLALRHYRDAYYLNSADNYSDQLNTILMGLIKSSFNARVYEESAAYLDQLRKRAEDNQDIATLAYAYKTLGRLHGIVLEDMPQARQYLLEAVNYYQEAEQPEALSSVYNNIGITYLNEKQYESALFYYEIAIEMAKKYQAPDDVHLLYSNITSLYIDLQQFEQAMRYNKLAMEQTALHQREEMLAFDYLNRGLIHYRQQQYALADSFTLQGVRLAEEANDLIRRSWGYELLKDIYKVQRRFEKATYYTEQLLLVKDSLNSIEAVRQLAEQASERELVEAEQEVARMESDAYRQGLIRNGIIILALITIVFLGLWINRNRTIVRLQKQELDKLNLIREMKAKEEDFLREKLQQQERTLASNTMQLIQKNEMLQDIKSNIDDLGESQSENAKVQIRELHRTIEKNMNFDDDWQRFKLHFEKVHSDFFDKLTQFSGLNSNDIRFSAYIKMGLNTKEIAQLMGINASSVQKARYRLKKKLNLEKSTNLIDFIQKI